MLIQAQIRSWNQPVYNVLIYFISTVGQTLLFLMLIQAQIRSWNQSVLGDEGQLLG